MMLQVIAHKGMLGSAVMREIRKRKLPYIPHDTDLEVVNVSHIKGDVVINCGGIVKQNHVSAAKMMEINAVGPHRLADACWLSQARLIQVSTDCVFGDLPTGGYGPFSEGARPRPGQDLYARSKLAGEVYGTHLTVRTSFVGFGKRGLLHDLQLKDAVRASRNMLWSGHTVDTIAWALVELALRINNIKGGILHIPGEFQNRVELCQRLKLRWDLEAEIIEDNSFDTDRRLVSLYWEKLGLPVLPSFETQLETMWRPS